MNKGILGYLVFAVVLASALLPFRPAVPSNVDTTTTIASSIPPFEAPDTVCWYVLSVAGQFDLGQSHGICSAVWLMQLPYESALQKASWHLLAREEMDRLSEEFGDIAEFPSNDAFFEYQDQVLDKAKEERANPLIREYSAITGPKACYLVEGEFQQDEILCEFPPCVKRLNSFWDLFVLMLPQLQLPTPAPEPAKPQPTPGSVNTSATVLALSIH